MHRPTLGAEREKADLSLMLLVQVMELQAAAGAFLLISGGTGGAWGVRSKPMN
jgi:hypothetical protein